MSMKMMQKMARLGVVAAAICMPASAIAQQVGEWVLSPWRGSRVLYPGVIEARSGTTVTVRFDDGSVESRPANTVRFFDWEPGSRISCQWDVDGKWYNAVIVTLSDNGYNMRIRYDQDGSLEDTTTGACRTR
jgi:hypothetical protein